MKPTNNQLPLFAKPAAKAAGAQERIVFCTRCGREIMAQRYVGGKVVTDYRSRTGECFACAFPAITSGRNNHQEPQ